MLEVIEDDVECVVGIGRLAIPVRRHVLRKSRRRADERD
jgi:hypothetical protein